MNPRVIKAIAVTAELTGTELSEMAIRVMEADLAAYPEGAAMRALDRCRKELKGRLTLAAVLERIESEDGRPAADEAWAIAFSSSDEAETVVWTEETAQAFSVAQPLLEARDKVGARMAFIDAYERLVRDARVAAVPCKWAVSLGYDKGRRVAAIQEAVTQKRLAPSAVPMHLLQNLEESPVAQALLCDRPQALLEQKDLSSDERETNRRGLARLKAHLEQLEREAEERSARYEAEDRERLEAMAQRKGVMLEQARNLEQANGGGSCAAASAEG